MPAQAPVPGSPAVLVDAHVHFHPCFDRDAFLDAALANFRRGAREVGAPEDAAGCLLLAEIRGEQWFRRTFHRTRELAGGRWAFDRTEEEESLVARPDCGTGGERLFLVAGRQIVTREGLEVLALATAASFADGLALEETLVQVRERGAVAVLPWGFGKWWFRRGALVGALLGRPEAAGVFLGDSGVRPRLGGRPRLFRVAEARGVPVLAGTDPLPFPEHATRAGAHGFLLAGPFDERRPAASVRRLLAGLAGAAGHPRAYGRPEGLFRFCRDQSAMQSRKLARRRAHAG